MSLLLSLFSAVPITASAANGSNLVSVAYKYRDYTQSQMGFSSAWCDLYVIRCAREAGLSSAIPNKPGCTNLYNAVKNAGGYVVSTPIAGDLAFYRYGSGNFFHVSIVTDGNYNTIHGNVTWCTKTWRDNGVSHVCTRAKGVFERAMGCNTVYLRPKYSASSHTHEFIYSCSCGAKTCVKNTKYYYDQCSTCKQANIADGWYRIALTQNKNYVMGTSSDVTSGQDKVQLQIYNSANDAQKVYIKYVGNGMYTIRFKKYGQYMDVKNCDSGSGVNICRHPANGTAAQEFAFIKTDTDTYYIKPRCGWNTLLDLYSNNVKSGTDIWTYTANFSVAQTWTLISENKKVSHNANGGKTSVSKTTTYANEMNRGRGNNELIIYNKSGTNTGTNLYGTEALVDDNNRVVEIRRYGANNSAVLSGKGFVISGHAGENIAWANAKSTWVEQNIKVGNYVTYDPKTLKITVYEDYNSYKLENTATAMNEKIGTLPTAYRSGYYFKGWYTGKSGGEKITSSSLNYKGTLYAQWAYKCTPSVSGYKTKTYNGKYQTQTLTVKCGSKTLKYGTDYTVSYCNNKWVGKASAKVNLKGNYSGSKIVYFTIKPKSTSLKSVSAGKKQVYLKWNRQVYQTSGYQIEYSTHNNFKNSKTVTVRCDKNISKTVTNLSGGKKYYFRVRTYKNVEGKRYYSSYSSSKNTTTKR